MNSSSGCQFKSWFCVVTSPWCTLSWSPGCRIWDFFKSLWSTSVLFVGPLMPVFWTSGHVSSWFQSQSGSLVCVLHCLHAMDSLDSPLVQHLLMSWQSAWQPSLFWSTYLYTYKHWWDSDPNWVCVAQCTLDVKLETSFMVNTWTVSENTDCSNYNSPWARINHRLN